jgi:hypothetical protein
MRPPGKEFVPMTSEECLPWIRKWFDMYVAQFCTGYEPYDSAICLKVRHTKNVVCEILDISNSLNLEADDRCRAEILALLHDIGRFEQYTRYHTYSDLASENHALLGLSIIKKTGVLNRFEHQDRELIESVVTHHNRAILPHSNDEQFLFFLKLLRDADKIDILHVVTDHYSGLDTNDAINIGLPDSPGVSGAIIDSIVQGKIAHVEDMRTLNDFKLLQISWVFDLHFPRTFEIVNERGYLAKLAAVLPHDNRLPEVIAGAQRFLMRKCTGERSECECPTP